MKVLNLTFRDSQGKTRRVRLTNVTTAHDKDTVHQIMDQLSGLKLFVAADGSELLAHPVAAEYVDTTAASLFKEEKTAPVTH
ncbi:DUF2922 domain-containing protein [Ligilactobacillus sp. LYQ112]|uniref:DUF2922 domain-containing protein n=1 Tax=unclassified Ligilactobacillus TaxID=2767920 RepID=UPI003851E3F5